MNSFSQNHKNANLFVNVAQEIKIVSTFLVFAMKISASSGKNVNTDILQTN